MLRVQGEGARFAPTGAIDILRSMTSGSELRVVVGRMSAGWLVRRRSDRGRAVGHPARSGDCAVTRSVRIDAEGDLHRVHLGEEDHGVFTSLTKALEYVCEVEKAHLQRYDPKLPGVSIKAARGINLAWVEIEGWSKERITLCLDGIYH
jgi:hypothetical protein